MSIVSISLNVSCKYIRVSLLQDVLESSSCKLQGLKILNKGMTRLVLTSNMHTCDKFLLVSQCFDSLEALHRPVHFFEYQIDRY
jgi:hypothetical protein